uniref:Integrase catalytic domain-containing protein n=1 Tax=Amphimedon queenslandica TaxID=400682 RepID=A0A1X7U5Z4_AMPQE
MVKSGSFCQENCNSIPEAPIHSWPWPSCTWSHLHIDFAGSLKNNTMLLFGLPDTIVSDNGPSLVSQDFESYLTQYGIHHIISSPYHPASNGLSERDVQLVKNGLKKLLM